MLMKEISFRSVLLTSSKSKTLLNAFTTHPRMVSTSKHTQHMHAHKQGCTKAAH